MIDASELVLDSVVAHGLFLIITASVSSLISSSVSPLELLDFSGVAMGAITSPLLSVFWNAKKLKVRHNFKKPVKSYLTNFLYSLNSLLIFKTHRSTIIASVIRSIMIINRFITFRISYWKINVKLYKTIRINSWYVLIIEII